MLEKFIESITKNKSVSAILVLIVSMLTYVGTVLADHTMRLVILEREVTSNGHMLTTYSVRVDEQHELLTRIDERQQMVLKMITEFKTDLKEHSKSDTRALHGTPRP